jgi:hypothetical protein
VATKTRTSGTPQDERTRAPANRPPLCVPIAVGRVLNHSGRFLESRVCDLFCHPSRQLFAPVAATDAVADNDLSQSASAARGELRHLGHGPSERRT